MPNTEMKQVFTDSNLNHMPDTAPCIATKHRGHDLDKSACVKINMSVQNGTYSARMLNETMIGYQFHTQRMVAGADQYTNQVFPQHS